MALLFSVRPKYASKIIEGTKKWKSAVAVVLVSVILVSVAFEPPAEAVVTMVSSVGT
jgi:hypothetical protein